MYIVSQITSYDNDNELFETYIGLQNKEMTLLYSAWGSTEKESRLMAVRICKLLNESVKTTSK